MEFIGVDGSGRSELKPAPLLKNAKIDEVLADLLYCQCINIMWKIYRECRLVHAGSPFCILSRFYWFATTSFSYLVPFAIILTRCR